MSSPSLGQFGNIRNASSRLSRGAERGDCIVPLRKSTFSLLSFSDRAAQEWDSVSVRIGLIICSNFIWRIHLSTFRLGNINTFMGQVYIPERDRTLLPWDVADPSSTGSHHPAGRVLLIVMEVWGGSRGGGVSKGKQQLGRHGEHLKAMLSLTPILKHLIPHTIHGTGQ